MQLQLPRSCVAMTGAVLLALPAFPGIVRAQPAPLAQPAGWCLRWTDSCTICTRKADGSEATCMLKPGKPSACVAKDVRCVQADPAALRAACEKPRIVLEACNACTLPDAQGRRTCTLIACPVRAIVCDRAAPVIAHHYSTQDKQHK